jgi:hypothetical protein
MRFICEGGQVFLELVPPQSDEWLDPPPKLRDNVSWTPTLDPNQTVLYYYDTNAYEPTFAHNAQGRLVGILDQIDH